MDCIEFEIGWSLLVMNVDLCIEDLQLLIKPPPCQAEQESEHQDDVPDGDFANSDFQGHNVF